MSNQSLIEVKRTLLEPAGLTEQHLQRILGNMLGNVVDAADLYFQAIRHESWVLENSIIKEGSHNIDRGVGVRAMSGEKTGFAYSDDIILPALESAALAAKSIAKVGGNQRVQAWKTSPGLVLYPALDPIDSLSEQQKVALLQRADRLARQTDPRIKEVTVSLSGVHDVVLIVASDGTFNSDIRPLVRFNVTVIAEENGRREQGFAGGGGRYSYQTIIDENLVEKFTQDAVRQALINLDAIDAPAGSMPVVLGSGWPGVLLHEAIGHGLEGDFNRKGSSAFSGRIGERVAAPECTVVDDGTLSGRRGSLNIDDEGVPTQCTVLIENGILKNYMQDKLNARLMNMAPTGNGRRESFACLPMPRMTNTYMLAGKHNPAEIIATVKKGIYAVNFGGGQVDITSGKFVFAASEAYLIENGKIGAPIKGATLIGNGPDVLTRVSMVGNDLALDTGVGVCGKEGQSVPVGVGQPTLLVEGLTVGGTQQG
ncbi:MAG: metalloprotease TldD [Legionellales bacterium]|nr:metalloprotease TldD [Legionellales bacterium]